MTGSMVAPKGTLIIRGLIMNKRSRLCALLLLLLKKHTQTQNIP